MKAGILLQCLLAALCCFGPVDAQSQGQVTTIKKQRVILIENFHPIDSGRVSSTTAISYSGRRGSTFKPSQFYFWERDAGYNFSPEPATYALADLPEPMQDVEKMDVQYDSVHYLFPHLSQRGDRKRLAFTARYNSNNKVIEHQAYEWRGGDWHYGGILERDATGQLVQIYITQGDSTSAADDTISQRVVVYDKQQRVSSDTLKDASPAGMDYVLVYEYDENGHARTVTELFTKKGMFGGYRSRQNFTRQSSGRIEEYTYELYRFGGWELNAKTSYNYDRDGRLAGWQTDSHPGDPATYRLHYNREGLADTLTVMYASGNIEKDVFFYNEFMNPDSSYTYYYSDTSRPKELIIARYHYELYDDTIMTPDRSPLVLYPNPAGSKVTIRWNAAKPGGPVYATLYSSTGQLVRRVYISSITDENTIGTSGLASGVYYLRITTQGGGMLHNEGLVINNNGQ